MKYALIDPRNDNALYVASWEEVIVDGKIIYKPIMAEYLDSERVAQVETIPFEIAKPYFWIECADNVMADKFYYDNATKNILPIVNAPFPGPEPT
jgi:hypothetical protein